MQEILMSSEDSTATVPPSTVPPSTVPPSNDDFVSRSRVSDGRTCESNDNSSNPLLFPWRHSTQPLPRLIPNTEEYNHDGGPMGPGFVSTSSFWRAVLTTFTATSIFQISLLHMLASDAWEQETANLFASSFETAVKVAVIGHGDTNNDRGAGGGGPFAEDMLESELLDLYRSARQKHHVQSYHGHDNTKPNSQSSPLQVKLSTTPVQAQIECLFPFLTDQSMNSPAFHELKKILLSNKQQRQNQHLILWQIFQHRDLLQSSLANNNNTNHHGDHPIVELSLLANCSILCRESFSVYDITNNCIVQGNDHGESMVWHFVRFRMTIQWDNNGKHWELGSWKILDWDDMLKNQIIT